MTGADWFTVVMGLEVLAFTIGLCLIPFPKYHGPPLPPPRRKAK